MPPEPNERFFSLALTNAANSRNVFGGSDGWITSNCGVEPTTATVAKSLIESYATFLISKGATTILVCGDINRV